MSKERVKVTERFGTFKVKRRVQKVCYPEKIRRVSNQEFELVFPQCKSTIKIQKQFSNQWKFSSQKNNPLNNLFIHLIFIGEKGEKYYGLGTQYSNLLLNNKNIEALSQEQGNGRGLQPISGLQRIFTPGIQGSEFSTYHSNGLVHSSSGSTVLIKSNEYMKFSFQYGDRFKVAHQGLNFSLNFAKHENIREALTTSSMWLGRQKDLPDWFHRAPIIGLMNTKNIESRTDLFFNQTISPSGFWLQDWVGIRETILGPRLNWDWKLDRNHYPNWNRLRSSLSERKSALMGYFNPYLSKIENRRGLYEEAREKEYLFKEEEKVFLVEMGGFKAALVDLLNPKAYSWLKDIIKKQVKVTGMKGWMADFGEAFPYKNNSFLKHHLYIEKWARLNKEVRDELERDGLRDLVSFHRSANAISPAFTSAMWLGDQTTTYDNKDGLQSSVTGLLTSGLSSVAYNHSDIGGYFGIKIPLITNIKRTKELLNRWLEVNAFTMIFRSHLGLNPSLFSQLDSSEQTLKSYNFYAQIFAALFPYRKRLIKEYRNTGRPPVRPLFVSFPGDKESYLISNQFMLGDNLLVAPLFADTAKKKRVYLPPGIWFNFWNNKRFESSGQWINITIENNRSPVFYKKHPELNFSTRLFQD